MNLDRIRILRDHIMHLNPKKFDMSCYVSDDKDSDLPPIELHRCGTAGCLAGWTVALFGSNFEQTSHRTHENARLLLDLSIEEANTLFFGNWWEGVVDEDRIVHRLEDITREATIDHLNTLLEQEPAQ